jgi:predicted PurR-regulated permease PerM
MASRAARRLSIDFSTATFVRAVVAVALCWVWLRLWPWLLIALAAVAHAAAIDPAVQWLERRRVSRPLAALGLVVGGALILVGLLALSAATLSDDWALLERRVVDTYRDAAGAMPAWLRESLASFAPSSNAGAAIGRSAVQLVTSVIVALALAVYFLLDGRRTFEWLVAFAPAPVRPRVVRTGEECRTALAAYVRGNLITSALTAIATWPVLAVLHVPGALLLALLAGICDLLPVVGIFLSAIPAIVLALAVSPATAAAVAAFFALYNLLENYYIQPKVYGEAMRLSDLAVIAAFLVGGELGGVLGALVALPLAAVYPTVEQIWLRGTGDDVRRAHRRVEATPEH